MNSPTLALRIASALFGLTGLVHLIRILMAVNVTVGTLTIGRRWSALAVVVLAVLCAWMWKASGMVAKSAEPAAPKPSA